MHIFNCNKTIKGYENEFTIYLPLFSAIPYYFYNNLCTTCFYNKCNKNGHELMNWFDICMIIQNKKIKSNLFHNIWMRRNNCYELRESNKYWFIVIWRC